MQTSMIKSSFDDKLESGGFPLLTDSGFKSFYLRNGELSKHDLCKANKRNHLKF